MVTRNLQNGAQELQKSNPKSTKNSKNRFPPLQNGAKRKTSKIKTDLTNKWGNSYRVVPFRAKKVTNMAPSWLPKSSKNRSKIDAKIDQKFDASWDRCLGGFGRILGAKMEPCWHPKGTQDGSYLESTKNQTKRRSTWEGILASIFD